MTGTEGPRPPKGWSTEGRAYYGLRDQGTEEPCYYCGVTGCTECGAPPAMLTGLASPDGDDPLGAP